MDWWTSLAASIALLWIFCFIDGKMKNVFGGDLGGSQEVCGQRDLTLLRRQLTEEIQPFISLHNMLKRLSTCVICWMGSIYPC